MARFQAGHKVTEPIDLHHMTKERRRRDTYYASRRSGGKGIYIMQGVKGTAAKGVRVYSTIYIKNECCHTKHIYLCIHVDLGPNYAGQTLNCVAGLSTSLHIVLQFIQLLFARSFVLNVSYR